MRYESVDLPIPSTEIKLLDVVRFKEKFAFVDLQISMAIENVPKITSSKLSGFLSDFPISAEY